MGMHKTQTEALKEVEYDKSQELPRTMPAWAVKFLLTGENILGQEWKIRVEEPERVGGIPTNERLVAEKIS